MDKLLAKLLASVLERTCKHYVTTIIGVLAFAASGGLALSSYAASQHFTWASTVGTIAAFLGLLAGAMGYDKQTVVKVAVFLLVLFGFSATVSAQTPVPAAKQFYAAGASYSVNATPAIAGTALYARSLNDVGTYAFTVVDAVPNTMKPFTITSNVGAGIAQKLFTLGKIPVYVPTAAGISWTGTNTGWNWNGGALAAIQLKNGYYIMPSVRFMKSSVSNGSGYQPIVGILFGWGK